MIHSHTLAIKQNFGVETKTETKRIRKRAASRGVIVPLGVTFATFTVGLVYLITLNSQSTHGYAHRKLEIEKSALIQEIRALDSRIGELSSIGVVETAAQSMEFVAADEVHYYVEETGVAAAVGADQTP